MNAAIKKQKRDAYRAAIKQLDGITGVMVRTSASRQAEDAGTLIAVEGFVAVVELRSGPMSGRTRDYPVDWVRPAEAFEVVGEVTA